MAGETILVIDDNAETEQEIVSTLETEGYLVFASPGGDVAIEMARKVSPSLIFVNPSATGSIGLELCKALHNAETLGRVPIIILTSLERAIDPRFTSLYGIIDSLKLPLDARELIEKTEKSLSVNPASVQAAPEYDEESEEVGRTTISIQPETAPQETAELQEDYSEDTGASNVIKIKQIRQKIGGELKEEMETERPYTPKKGMRRIHSKSSYLIPAVALVAVILIAGGFLLYKGLRTGTKVQKPVMARPARPVQPQTAEVSRPQEPPQQQPASEGKSAPATAPAAPTSSVSAPAPKPVTPPPTPAPAQVPQPTPVSKPAGKTIFSVQLGAFKNETSAEALTKKFKEKGYESFLHKSASKDKGTLYRVLIGRFEDRKESLKQAGIIQSKEKVKVTIFSE